MSSLLEQLENRIRSLVEKVNKLRADNHRLHEELAISRQDFAEQSKVLEIERNKLADTANASKEQEALQDILKHREQELQLLEKERLNLRDQIAFLQNTIQTKEKDWKNRHENARLEYDEQLAASQERISDLELKLQVLQIDADQALSTCDEQKQLLADSETKISQQEQTIQTLETKLADLNEKYTVYQQETQEQETVAKAEFEAKLAQENERFRIEYALLGKQHEQNLSDLTQALNQQKERLREERNLAQEKANQLLEQNQVYRSILEKNIHNIQELLSQMSVVDTQSEPKQDKNNEDKDNHL